MRSRDTGLSLVEVLVALTLLGMITVMAAGGIRFGSAAWQRSANHSTAALEHEATTAFLRRQIAAARALRIADGSREPPVLFDGTEETLAIVAPITAAAAPPGLQAITLSPVLRGSRVALTFAWATVGQDPPEWPEYGTGDTLIYLEGRLTFRYFGSIGGAAPDWHQVWRFQPQLPSLVELRFGSPEGAQDAAPHVIALDPAHRS